MKPGIYKHYKGKLYEVLYVGINSETLDKQVVYKQLYDSTNFPMGSIWIRPYKMFNEKIEINGKVSPRFEFIGNKKYNEL